MKSWTVLLLSCALARFIGPENQANSLTELSAKLSYTGNGGWNTHLKRNGVWRMASDKIRCFCWFDDNRWWYISKQYKYIEKAYLVTATKCYTKNGKVIVGGKYWAVGA